MQRKSWASSKCPMARSVDVIGDWGSLLILREAFGGTTRFDDFQKKLDISRNLLTARLKKLVARGIFKRRPIAEEARRHEYVLTEMGEDLLPMIIALRQWGDRWLFRPLPAPYGMFDTVMVPSLRRSQCVPREVAKFVVSILGFALLPRTSQAADPAESVSEEVRWACQHARVDVKVQY